MTATVLCPGESLNLYDPATRADIVLAVNRAGLAWRCDIWCALDYPMIKHNGAKVLGTPHLLSRQQTIDDMRGRLGRFREIVAMEDLPMPLGLKHPKTAMAALLYAAWRGATRIEVYGADWKGENDFDGAKAGEDRTDKRWAEERNTWEGVLVPWLAERGVEVERCVVAT